MSSRMKRKDKNSLDGRGKIGLPFQVYLSLATAAFFMAFMDIAAYTYHSIVIDKLNFPDFPTKLSIIAKTAIVDIGFGCIMGLVAAAYFVLSRRARSIGIPGVLFRLAPLLCFFFLVGTGLFSGRRFHVMGASTIPAALFAFFAIVPIIAAWDRLASLADSIIRSPKAAGVLIAFLWAAAIAFFALDVLAYPGLYEELHAALLIAAFSSSAAAIFIDRREWGVNKNRALAIGFFSLLALAPFFWISVSLSGSGLESFILKSRTQMTSKYARLLSFVVEDDGDDRERLDFHENAGAELPFSWLKAAAKPVDVVLITIDALRADMIGMRHGGREICPNLNRLSERSVFFRNAFTVQPNTSANLFAFATGNYPPDEYAGAEYGCKPVDSIYSRLKRRDYKTYCDRVIHARFDSRLLRCDVLHDSRESTAVLASLGAFLEGSEKDRPMLIHVHFFDPHDPYEKHEGFDYGDGDFERYMSEVAFADAGFARLERLLTENGIWNSALIVVSSDHGEEFGEHGMNFHASNLYSAQTRIPIWFVNPEFKPRVIEVPISSADVATTLFHLLGFPLSEVSVGRSRAPYLLGEDGPQTALYLHIKTRFGILEYPFKLIFNQPLNSFELYQIRSDPGETRNLIEEETEDFERLKPKLLGWTDYVKSHRF